MPRLDEASLYVGNDQADVAEVASTEVYAAGGSNPLAGARLAYNFTAGDTMNGSEWQVGRPGNTNELIKSDLAYSANGVAWQPSGIRHGMVTLLTLPSDVPIFNWSVVFHYEMFGAAMRNANTCTVSVVHDRLNNWDAETCGIQFTCNPSNWVLRSYAYQDNASSFTYTAFDSIDSTTPPASGEGVAISWLPTYVSQPASGLKSYFKSPDSGYDVHQLADWYPGHPYDPAVTPSTLNTCTLQFNSANTNPGVRMYIKGLYLFDHTLDADTALAIEDFLLG